MLLRLHQTTCLSDEEWRSFKGEIDYDDYEYCPKCGQHIDLDSLEQECEDTEDEE